MGGGTAGEPSGDRSVWPNLLTGSRLLLGPLFAVVFSAAPGAAFVIALVAAATDFVDGRLARRLGVGSARGAVLDVVADAVFVLTGLGVLASAGVLSVTLPIGAAVSLSALGVAWWRGPARVASQVRGWPDLVGHAAGILNYGAVLVGSGFVAFDVPIGLVHASQLVALLNVLPIVLRWLGRPSSG